MLYLVSASPRRRELIKKITDNFKTLSADVQEQEEGLNPARLAVYNAAIKAQWARERVQDGYIIGADTVVAIKKIILGKPQNIKQAESMLKTLSGNTHKVITGICVINPQGQIFSRACITYVEFNKLDNTFISQYINSGKPFDKAGGYGIQDSVLFVKKIKGSRLNVIGFPVKTVKNLLSKAGYNNTD